MVCFGYKGKGKYLFPTQFYLSEQTKICISLTSSFIGKKNIYIYFLNNESTHF